jgi:hypothetical protein
MRNVKTIAFLGAALFALSTSADAASPPRLQKKVNKQVSKSTTKLDTVPLPAVAPVPKHVPTQEELKLEAKHRQFEASRVQAMNKRYTHAPRNEKVVRSEARVRLERVVDGAVVISSPYPPEKEAALMTGGFSKVSRAEDALDLALFGGRAYRMVQLARGTAKDFERSAGREVVLSLETHHEGLVRATAVRPVR